MAGAERVSQEATLYEFVGGRETFFRLADAFYRGVVVDPILGPMYPAEDMEGSRDRLALFLMQYWDGPQTYNEQRGHPRLRMRHFPFPIDEAARDAWLRCMMAALDEVGIPEPARQMMVNHFEHTANFLVNRQA